MSSFKACKTFDFDQIAFNTLEKFFQDCLNPFYLRGNYRKHYVNHPRSQGSFVLFDKVTALRRHKFKKQEKSSGIEVAFLVT